MREGWWNDTHTHTVDVTQTEIDGFAARIAESYGHVADAQGLSVAIVTALRTFYGTAAYLQNAIEAEPLLAALDVIKNKVMAAEVDKARGKPRQ